MGVLRFPAKPRSLSILDGWPNKASSSSFMGFVETVAWVALRDERAAAAARWHSLDRPDLDRDWIGAAWLMLLADIGGPSGSLAATEAEIIDKCASGQLKGKGRGSDGFHDIPENDWLGAHFIAHHQPDSIVTAGLGGKGWTHVQFRRVDVLNIWPAPEPQALGAVPVGPLTNKAPVWYPKLRSMMQQEHERLEAWAEKHPSDHPPQFPRASRFRAMLVKSGFEEPPASTVRYHVARIKAELGR